jgi:tRNA pseudouridine55 synthase
MGRVSLPVVRIDGVLILDKPTGMSSARAVDLVKRALNADRAGHGGTLDPLATGVLPVCLGQATKLAQYMLADDKEYEAEAILGIETDTLDRTGRVLAERPVDVTREALLAACLSRMGAQAQVPPMYSAIKKDGVELYKRARRGEEVELTARAVRIDRLDLVDFESPKFKLSIACGKGTYVRSLVADLGNDVGCGASLTELRRTRVGRFSIADAVSLDDIESLATRERIIPLVAATDLPTIVIPPDVLMKVRNAIQIPVGDLLVELPERFLLLDAEGRPIAIAHGDADGKVIYDRVLAPGQLP